MAYALKYTYNFFQVKNYTQDEYQLKIYLEGYGGGSSAIDNIAAGTIKLSREGELLDNVLGTKLTFSLVNSTEGQYKEFRTASWGDYKVELIKDPSGTPETKFVGYNQSEIYSEPYDQPPYDSALEFTCGLSHLKHVRFDNSGTLYTGQKSIIEVLRLCLNKLPEPLAIREFINVYEDSINSTTTDSMINQIYVDSEVYKEKENDEDDDSEVGWFCNQVIEEILKPFNAHIYQADEKWFILRPQEYEESTMYYRDFNANVGTESTITVDGTGNLTTNRRSLTGADNGNANELVLVAPSTELTIEPPLNRVKITYNQNTLDSEDSNIIKNSCWKDRTVSGANNYESPSYWSETGNDSTTYQAFYQWVNGRYFTFDNTASAQENANSSDITKYIEQTKTGIAIATTDSLEFTFDFGFNAIVESQPLSQPTPNLFFYNSFKITFEVQIIIGTYYLSGDPDTGYSWTTTSSIAKFWKLGDWDVSGGSQAIYRFDQMWTISETLPTLPLNGIYAFTFKFLRPYSNWSDAKPNFTNYTWTWNSLGVKCIKLVYLPNENPPPTEKIVYSKIDEDENVEEIEVTHADGLTSNATTSFRLSSGTITDVWTRRGKADNADILTILARQLRDLRGDFIRLLNGTLIGEFDIYNTIRDTYDGTIDYWIKSYDWDIMTNEYSVELMELRDNSAISTTITNELDVIGLTQANNQNGGSSTIGDPIGTESIVTQPSPIQVDQNDLNNYPI